MFFTLHHVAVFGMTQLSGKTTLLEGCISRAGLPSLAFRTKRGEAGFHKYNLVPPYYVARSDWQYLEGLVNTALGEKVKYEPGMRYAIMRVTEGTNGDLANILGKSKRLEKDSKRSFDKSVYHKLTTYLQGVVTNMSKFVFSNTLTLEPGINLMDLSAMEHYPEIQQIVIASALNYVHENLAQTICLLPEAWEMLPQGRMTPVKWSAERFIRKGAAIGNYLWLDSQDIGGLDKTPLRQVDNWFIGRMKEAHEVSRLIKQLLGADIDPTDIQTLPLGHFYAAIGNKVKKIYALPAGVPEQDGISVAKGGFSAESVRDQFLKPTEKPPDEVKVEQLQQKNIALETQVQKLQQEIEQLPEKIIAELSKPSTRHMTAEGRTTDSGMTSTPLDDLPNAESRDTLEVHNPIALVEVKDVALNLKTDTTTLEGAIAQLIIEGHLEPNRKFRVGDVKTLLLNHFEGTHWGDGQILEVLRKLTGAPYRLFVHTIDPQRRNHFVLVRKERVVQA